MAPPPVPAHLRQAPPPPSLSAKAPPPPQAPPEPEGDEYDDDDAPTAMFVHSVKYSYDPDGPPGQADMFDDDDDEDEPPTAIHVSPYRGDASGPAPGFGAQGPAGPPLSPGGEPGLPASAALPAAPVAQPPSAAETQRVPQRYVATQQLDPINMPTPPPVGVAARGVDGGVVGGTQAGSSDYAPTWLKALAISSIVSAVTVIVTLAWMITQRM